MALGLGVVIRNDFRYGDDVEAYLKLTVEKLAPHYPEHEIVYDQDRIWFIDKNDEVEMDLLLASGFWYVINEFAMADLYNRNFELSLQTYRLAEALRAYEVWYCNEYVMDSVCLEYTFEQFMEKAKVSGIMEVDDNLSLDCGTTFFHEDIPSLSCNRKYLYEYNLVIFDSVDEVKALAKKHGVELTLGTYCGDSGYVFQVEYQAGGHPFIRELEDSDLPVYLSWGNPIKQIN